MKVEVNAHTLQDVIQSLSTIEHALLQIRTQIKIGNKIESERKCESAIGILEQVKERIANLPNKKGV